MTMQVVGGTLAIPQNATATITPPAGEVWAITHLEASGFSYGATNLRLGVAVGASASTGNVPLHGAATNNDASSIRYGAKPSGPLMISNANYLSMLAQGTAQTVIYTGVKL